MIKILKIISVVLMLIGISALVPQSNAREIPQSKSQVQLSFSPLVKKVAPTVVNIYTKRVVRQRSRSASPFMGDPFFEQFFGGGFGGNLGQGLSQSKVESSLGTGLIVDGSGVIVTNAHVIKGAQEISVVTHDGQEFDAKISLADERTDLAILRVDTQGKRLRAAKFKPSEGLEVGDIVLAIGNPFGVGQTVTSGIISALARSSLDISDFNFFIQTDAAINPGNSGGPLVAMDGSVIGLNTAIYSESGGSLGIGFAIPSEMVQQVIGAEKSGATNAGAVRPWIGVTGQSVTRDIASSLDLNKSAGVLVSKIHKESPARKAGLQVGDVITAINGKAVNDPAEMKFRLATVPLGNMADLTVISRGDQRVLKMQAMQPPEDPPRRKVTLQGNHPLSSVTVGNMNPRLGVELGVDSDREGVVVISARNRLVKAGDFIISVNGDEVEDVKDLQKEIAQAASRRSFDIIVESEGVQSRISVR